MLMSIDGEGYTLSQMLHIELAYHQFDVLQ
jgi:hypothetical protein